ncbi:hypothetical protein VTH06DRAFT_8723 [Thermothelomyces fergusii]
MSPSPAGPRGPPMAEHSAVLPPQDNPETSGQDHQYAETLQNPFPEVIPCPAASTAGGTAAASPAAVSNADDANNAAMENDTRSSLHNQGTIGSKEDRVVPEDVWVEPKEDPWYRAISPKKWATIVICTVGITGVVLAILGAMDKLSGKSSSDASSPGEDEASITSKTTATPTAPAGPNPTADPSPTDPSQQHPLSSKIDCGDNSTFLAAINWVGTTVDSYTSAFAQAASAAGCCAACEGHPGGGCAGWLYTPGSDFTPCTKIIVSREQDDRGGVDDGSCPLGRVPVTFFNQDIDSDGGTRSTAGMGPCSVEGKLQQ